MAIGARVYSFLDDISLSQRAEREKNLEAIRIAALERTQKLADAVTRDESLSRDEWKFLRDNTTSHEYLNLLMGVEKRAALRRESFCKYIAALRTRAFEARRDKIRKVLR